MQRCIVMIKAILLYSLLAGSLLAACSNKEKTGARSLQRSSAERVVKKGSQPFKRQKPSTLLKAKGAKAGIMAGSPVESARKHYMTAMAKWYMQDLDGALGELKIAVKLNPSYADAYMYLGAININKKDYHAVVYHAGKVIELEPRRAQAYILRARGYRALGRYKKAVADLEQALRLNPKDGKVHNVLAWFLVTVDTPGVANRQKGLAHALKAVELKRDQFSLDTLACAHASLGDFKKAVRKAEEALASCPQKSTSYCQMLKLRLENFGKKLTCPAMKNIMTKNLKGRRPSGGKAP